jgi:energy-coupling factor transporter ATP-binding protein EcfA2
MEFTNIPSISVNDFADTYVVPMAIEEGQTLGLFGAPGSGKTHIIRSVKQVLATYYNLPIEQVGFYEFHASTRDEVETHGFALPVKRTSPTDPLRVEFAMSPVAVEIQKQVDAGCTVGILFIDEVTQCGEAMQKALRDVIDPETRELGGWKIPDTWLVLVAGNRVADGAGSTRLLSHFSNAMARFNVVDDVDGWIENFAVQQVDKPLHPLMIGLAKAMGDDLFVKEMPIEDVQVCTFRSFTRAARLLYRLGPDVPVMTHASKTMMQSLMGFDATEIAFNWLATWDRLPTAGDIQANPETALLPEETDLQFAACQIAVASVTDAETADKALQYVTRCKPDLAISSGAHLLKRVQKLPDNVIMTGENAVKFISKYGDILPLTEGV